VNEFTVVTGVSKSHLLRTMKLLDDLNLLQIGITSFVPKKRMLIKIFPKKIRNKFISRLENIENLPRKSHVLPETLYQIGRMLHRNGCYVIADFVISVSFELHSYLANRIITNTPDLRNCRLLVRAGFGSRIKKGNRFLIIDASLAHPLTLPTLLMSGEFGLTSVQELSRLDKLILNDAINADLILVNSDFVRDSYIYAGIDAERIVVSYLPPLPIFLASPDKRIRRETGLRILFAGGLERRKGIVLIREVADILQQAKMNFNLNLVGNWGEIDLEVKEALLNNPHVSIQSWMPESELAAEMANADIFLFPSYAEGGARVVTEAMALGKAVITTWNSGSPITHGYDGIISLLDSKALVNWILKLANEPTLKSEIEVNAKQTVLTKLSDNSYVEILRELGSFSA